MTAFGNVYSGREIGKDRELVKDKVENIPLFYLALPKRHIEEGIRQLNPSFEENSAYEQKLFSYFLACFFHQINYLKLERDLNPLLKNRLEQFERILQKGDQTKFADILFR